jgi:protein phosphatase
MLTVCTRTHPGTVRTINEDSSLWDPDLAAIAVADGMGGHNAGEVASQMALDTIRTFLEKSATTDDFTWPFGFSPALSFAANRLMTAIKVANRRVFRASEERPDYTGMGTTVVAAIVEGSRVAYSGVGDSRIYSFLDGRLEQLTRDESWMAALQSQGKLDPQALSRHPMRHVLTNVIGARETVDAQVGERALRRGERLLLCTDGLHGALDGAAIAGVLAQARQPAEASAALVAAALRRGATDNVTALVMDYCGGYDPAAPGAPDEGAGRGQL